MVAVLAADRAPGPHVLIEAHLAAAEQTAALVREAGKTAQ